MEWSVGSNLSEVLECFPLGTHTHTHTPLSLSHTTPPPLYPLSPATLSSVAAAHSVRSVSGWW